MMAPDPASGGWSWRASAGPAYRKLGGVSFDTGTFSNRAMFQALVPRLSAGRAANPGETGIGPADRFADRTYRDGFVRRDGATENPNSFLPGTTAYWGYENNSQVQGGSLLYNGGEYATAAANSGSEANSGDWRDDLENGAFALELDMIRPLGGDLKWGAGFGFIFTPMDARRSVSTFSGFLSLNEQAFGVTDLYNLQDVVPPAAPYAGTFDHPGTAPLIDNIPSARLINRIAAEGQRADFKNVVNQEFDLGLYTFSIAPVLEWQRGRFSFSGRAGLALNIANWDASFHERLLRRRSGTTREIASWQRRRSGTDVLPGFFLQAAAAYQINDRWSVSVFGRYDWNESLRGSVGPSSFSADLSGGTMGTFITFNF